MLWRTRFRWLARRLRDRVWNGCDRYKWSAWFHARITTTGWPDHQPAEYSLNWVRYISTIARWLAGLSGAGIVLAFAFYMQACLSILSIKDDCVARHFVADAMKGAVQFVYLLLSAGLFALAAIAWPAAMVGPRRN